ncbi:Flp family type IVb pilin [Pararhizobium haloflavum]|uniref:Flp family type IVb pilin n=1 Tax=Pararhizobium haloflavum TaxID=2037914 RepID=UPI000C181F5F|nr:Flp family type IVb pilin [Pararhizobium haloflavum]
MLKLRRLLQSRRGATSIEYGLIASLMSIAIIGGAMAMSNNVVDLYDGVAKKVSDAINGPPPAGDGDENA